MEANELRLGNLILLDGVIIEVSIIDLRVLDNPMMTKATDKFKPIPLTEEWLIKFGFRPNKHGYIFDTFRVKNWVTGFFYGYIPVFLDGEEEDIEDVQIKYVHQLQNLYFALTGEELKIK